VHYGKNAKGADWKQMQSSKKVIWKNAVLLYKVQEGRLAKNKANPNIRIPAQKHT
jgi:hypothetical protein